MRNPIRAALALAALGSVVMISAAQTPPAEDWKKKKPPAEGSLEAAIAGAERNHPDVRIAEAKLRVAEAELAQARLLVAQRVLKAHAAVAGARVQVQVAEEDYRRTQKLIEQGLAAPKTGQRDLAEARAALAAAEAELRAAQGLAPGQSTSDRGFLHNESTAVVNRVLLLSQAMMGGQAAHPEPGSPLDRLRAIALKRVTLDVKKPVPFDEALAQLAKSSGLTELTVRSPEWASGKYLKEPPLVGPLSGENTTAAWLQLILDDFNREVAAGRVLPPHSGKYDAYVRDYGLLITRVDLAPPGTLTLAEFVQHAQAEGERKKR